ncbi:TPA: hypothetical protein QDC20_006750 [Burkholderia aenigmatica]|uniref:hypothetical protein n=1 Tax=Burkholderia sp. AU45251 TaxID=3059204 RepID=UPI00264E924C|nr:hypothetical protein [Burkholderia sp. AU45251]HDR9487654.1 hypothetical protein [Burkholderia aenigmatica]MDN7520571.1 hypothetical protein [Burkholderia sp. AU45251]HDR9519432.1 hypothetical protein [Burkholderia aenigmatica]HDR9596462.1 hypothetical protein [Burkholderia aenigmatica]HDR9603839.1 hypothetical protein [Burkholderia aenigmatica]
MNRGDRQRDAQVDCCCSDRDWSDDGQVKCKPAGNTADETVIGPSHRTALCVNDRSASQKRGYIDRFQLLQQRDTQFLQSPL